MKKTTYWKDVWRTFVASKGRMLSIALLMALGSFALIGLKVTSPNMKKIERKLKEKIMPGY